MYVVVFIKAAKKKIIILEEWIYDVNEELLKNKGVNSNRDVLIFWSKSAIDANGWPDSTHPPNFLTAKSVDFPPANDEACYHARVIHYFESFEMALAYCEKFRPKLPPDYNPNRQFDKPIPSLNPVSPAINAANNNGQQDSDEEIVDNSSNDQNNDENSVDEGHQQNEYVLNDDDGGNRQPDDVESNASEENTTNGQIQNNETLLSEDGFDNDFSADADLNSAHVEEPNTTDEPFQSNESVLNEDGIDENRSANDVENPILDHGGNLTGEEQQNNENETSIGNGNVNEQSGIDDTGNEDVKHSLRTVQMNVSDELAINSVFDNSASDEPSENDEICDQTELTLGDGETAEKRVTKSL